MSRFNLLARAGKRIARNPALLGEALVYAKNDLLSRLGYYHYRYPIIFIAGLPKSGTTWLETQLARVPGYNLRPIHDPRGVALNHDVEDENFDCLPRRCYSLLKLHTRYSEENFRVICRHVPKFAVTIRDLRDMCMSNYFHILSERTHPSHALYTQLSREDGLMHRIDVTGQEYVPWVRDWLKCARTYSERVFLLKYEDLNNDPYRAFQAVFEFFELPGDQRLLSELERSKLSTEKDLRQELHGGGGRRTRSTARKGIVGDWRNHFGAAHKARFKQVAGELLIEAGYERDLDW